MDIKINRQQHLPALKGRLLRWSRNVFFVIGTLALGYCAFVLLDARLFQAGETSRFEHALQDAKPATSNGEAAASAAPSGSGAEAGGPKANSTKGSGHARAVGEGDSLGRIEIARIGLAVMVLEGIDEVTLRRAVGHIPDTAMPGEQGNVALAGHRDTFFRTLRNIRLGDEITLKTLAASYRYEVDSTRIVAPDDTDVLDDARDDILTLVTCYPFDFVGHAPKRFIVRAHMIP